MLINCNNDNAITSVSVGYYKSYVLILLYTLTLFTLLLKIVAQNAEIQLSKAEIDKLAYYNALTGLCNNALFFERIASVLTLVKKKAVLLIRNGREEGLISLQYLQIYSPYQIVELKK